MCQSKVDLEEELKDLYDEKYVYGDNKTTPDPNCHLLVARLFCMKYKTSLVIDQHYQESCWITIVLFPNGGYLQTSAYEKATIIPTTYVPDQIVMYMIPKAGERTELHYTMINSEYKCLYYKK